jgi:hypothetical protein
MEGLFKGLLWPFLTSGGGGLVAFWLLEKPIGKNIAAWLTNVQAQIFAFNSRQVMRILAYVIGLIASFAMYSVGVGLGWATFPAGLEQWLNLGVWLLGISFSSSHAAHLFTLEE